MAKNIPKVLSTFVSSDSDTARMYSNLQAAVQPLLDFNAKWFSVKGSVLNVTGALQSLGAAVLTSFRAVPDGTLLAPGLAFLSNGTIGFERQGTGNAEQFNFRFNGVTFLSVTKGGYIWTSFSSTSAISFNNALGNLIGSISNAGVLNFPSYISQQGFKNTLACTHWNSAYTANALAQMQLACFNNNGNTVGSTPFVFKWPVPGSIVALNCNQAGPVTGTNVVLIYRNGTNVYNWSAGAGGNSTAYAVSYPKGIAALSFVANDVMTVFHQNTAAGNTQLLLHITIEMGA